VKRPPRVVAAGVSMRLVVQAQGGERLDTGEAGASKQEDALARSLRRRRTETQRAPIWHPHEPARGASRSLGGGRSPARGTRGDDRPPGRLCGATDGFAVVGDRGVEVGVETTAVRTTMLADAASGLRALWAFLHAAREARTARPPGGRQSPSSRRPLSPRYADHRGDDQERRDARASMATDRPGRRARVVQGARLRGLCRP